jgi:cytosine/adenosine deaminase-related metal-dependent hydrolase
VLLAHCLGIDEGEVDCIARTGTTVAMCPVTAAKSGRGVPEHGRMPELLARGVKIALGCDSPNNSNHLDIVRAMNMAAIQYKDARQDLRQVPAEAALEMATLHGAQAMGLGDELGSHRGRQEGRPRLLRHPAPGVAGPVESRQQPRVQRGRPQRAYGGD